MVKGNQPTRGLIPHQDEWRRERSSEERLTDVLARRQWALRDGRPYTSVDIDLRPHGVDITADKIVLHATEEVALHFNRGHHPNEPVREDATRMRIEHNFVFTNPGLSGSAPKKPSIVAVAYRPQSNDPMIIADEQPPPDPNVDPSSPALLPEATGYVPPAVSPTVDCPSCIASAGFSYYNGTNAAQYAYDNAWVYNQSYRRFGNDCTNFASQCLSAGGWNYSGVFFGIKKWNHWWYDIYTTQTRTWTMANALFYFANVSGRGQFLNYFSQTQPGNLMMASWTNNGVVDHQMVVDAVYSSALGDIYVSYHTNDTRHRPFVEIFNQNPHAAFYDYTPIYNVATY